MPFYLFSQTFTLPGSGKSFFLPHMLSLHNDHSDKQEINKKRLALTLELKVAGVPFIHTVIVPRSHRYVILAGFCVTKEFSKVELRDFEKSLVSGYR